MSYRRLAEGYLKQAGRRLRTAKGALDEDDYAFAIRQSQECVELSLKAALRLVGIDYPKVHDVSLVLERVGDRFPEWFAREVGFMAKASRTLTEYRGPSVYGIEANLVPPEELFDRDDAERALGYAERTYESCRRLLEEL